MARRAQTDSKAELAKLIAAQARDLNTGTTWREPEVEATTNHAPLSDLAGSRAKAQRRPRVRKGAARTVFRDGPIVHTDMVTIDGASMKLDGEPRSAPMDWVDVAVSLITGAKLALLSYLDGVRDVPDEQRPGIPDPRGPRLEPGEVVSVSPMGVMIQRGGHVEFVGRGEAMPAAMLVRMQATQHPPPNWVSEPLLNWLVELASLDGGGAGQLGAARLGKLLRDPPALSKDLMRRAGVNVQLKSIAAKLPRKGPRRRVP